MNTTADLLLAMEELAARSPAWVTEMPGPAPADPETIQLCWSETRADVGPLVVLASCRVSAGGLHLELTGLDEQDREHYLDEPEVACLEALAERIRRREPLPPTWSPGQLHLVGV